MLPPNSLGLRALTDAEIRCVSFGRIISPQVPSDGDWRALKGTLADPVAFGPPRSWRCACGETTVERGATKTICHQCGSPAGDARRLRRRRFGHIQLWQEIRHPLFHDAAISVIPVLPIAFRRPTGMSAGLNGLYTAVLLANEARDDVAPSVARLYGHEWDHQSRGPASDLSMSILMCLQLTSCPAHAAILLQGLGVGYRVAESRAE